MENEFSPRASYPVLVIGSSSVDMIGRLSGEINLGTSNPAHIRTSFGGVARNIAENLAHLGQPVILLSAVGQDRAGKQILAEMDLFGVDTRYTIQSDQNPTGTYLGIVDQKGELEVALDDMRAISEITPAYIRDLARLFKEISAVYIDANLTKETIRTIVSLARKANIPVCADPTSFSLAVKLKPYLKNIKMLTPNITEVGILSDRKPSPTRRADALQAAKDLVSVGLSIVAVVMPELDVIYATTETSGLISAIRAPIVDPTGAGDALSAAVLYGLLNNMPVDDAVRLGASALSLTMSQIGSVVPDLSLQKLYDHLVA